MIENILGVLAVVTLVAGAKLGDVLLQFIFFYPLFMAFIWMVGGAYFYLHWERHGAGPEATPDVPGNPFASILIPCFNEGENARETINAALATNYENFEVIAINDGSKDDTGAVLDSMLAANPRLRVIHLARNQGKAMALRAGALAAKGEYLVCIDGDALLHPNALGYLVRPMVMNPRVGAVTGNPRIRTRSTLIGRIQVGEFSSIVGLIKRAQRIYGNVFTVSGVVAAFRRAALARDAIWSPDMITDDIDISWGLQLNHWSIQYEPQAVCWILMPETLKGLWRQRLRWAQGGAEVFLKYFGHVWAWRRRRMWLLFAEYALSVAWAFAFMLSIVLFLLGQVFVMPEGLNVPTILPPRFWGLLLAVVCLGQFATALLIESRYERNLFRQTYWIIWYPIVYWFITVATSLVGFPKALLKRRGTRARWISPDRGLRA